MRFIYRLSVAMVLVSVILAFTFLAMGIITSEPGPAVASAMWVLNIFLWWSNAVRSKALL